MLVVEFVILAHHHMFFTVMHNGIEPYDGVLQVIHGLKQAGKKLIILSNSSKRRDNSVEMLIKRECQHDLGAGLIITVIEFTHFD